MQVGEHCRCIVPGLGGCEVNHAVCLIQRETTQIKRTQKVNENKHKT